MNPIWIASQWSTLCHSARTNASRLMEGASPWAVELMTSESNRFCEGAPPQDKNALESAYTRRMALSARLTAISRADALAQAHPAAAPDLHAQLREFCEEHLPDASDEYLDMQLRNIELTKTVVAICSARHPA